ncbi:hypothetical protein BDZ89DRAFT_929586, partial [Hymenopellis radicata]
VALYTFLSPLASSMMAPGLPTIGITNETVLALTLSVYLLSFAIGVGTTQPLFLAPVSEITFSFSTCGDHSTNVTGSGHEEHSLAMGCAYAPTTGSFIGFALLSGFAGSAPIAFGGGT